MLLRIRVPGVVVLNCVAVSTDVHRRCCHGCCQISPRPIMFSDRRHLRDRSGQPKATGSQMPLLAAAAGSSGLSAMGPPGCRGKGYLPFAARMPAVAPKAAPAIRFVGTAQRVGQSTILLLPQDASRKLPSRGQVAVNGTINGRRFEAVLEPDGRFGHWIKLDGKMQRAVHLVAGTTANVEIAPSTEWPEPKVPPDLQAALDAAPSRIQAIWTDITPMARWEWVRWVNATRNPSTRNRRVDVTISKMAHGKRRPCCFDLSACTDPDLALNGKLRESAPPAN